MMESLKERIFKRLIENHPIQAVEINEMLSPSIGIKILSSSSPYSDEPRSKFGGHPELPDNFSWPESNGNKLTFFCQLNLEELERFQAFSILPNNGTLYFFMLTKGLDRYPENKNEFCVAYSESNENLSIYSQELDIQVFDEVRIDFFEYFTLPAYQSHFLRDKTIDISNAIDDFKEEMYDMVNKELDDYNQILGHPQSVQNDVAYEWAFKKSNAIEKSWIKELESEYVNLLQIDFANSGTNFSEYGGDGVAYFGIGYEDLIQKQFDKSSLIIQST